MSPALRQPPPLTQAERECLPGTTPRVLRLGTRASALATTQSEWVASRLRARGQEVQLVPVRTEGDASDRPLTEIGGTGVFATALRRALREGRIDLAVHSLKDLPVAAEPGLVIAAVPEREDARDVLVARDGLTLAELPEGAVVGTGAPRRAAQLRLAAPHLAVRDIRGNVDTRIGKVRAGELDAVVLAAAGLRRLGRLAEASQVLDPELMLPAPGQGALAVEARTDDEPVHAVLAAIDDEPTRRCVRAERALLARLEAGCTAPVAALARHAGSGLELTGFLALEAGAARYRLHGGDPVALAHRLADLLLGHLRPADPDLPPADTDHTERDT